MGIFPDAQWQLTPQSKQGLIWPNFEPIRALMVVLVICKNGEDPINDEGAREVTRLFIDFPNAQGQLTLKSVMVSCQNSSSSERIW